MESLLITLAVIALVVWIVLLVMRVAAHWVPLGILILILLLWWLL